MANILRAFEIDYGTHNALTVLIDPADRSLWVTQAALEVLLGWPEKRAGEKIASKSFQAFLTGAKKQPPRGTKASQDKALTGTKKRAKDSLGRTNTYKAFLFPEALKVIYWQLKEGNEAAAKLLLAGFADSFTSMAYEQAGIQVTTEERQQVLSFYLTGYHEMFDWVRDTYLEKYGEKPDAAVYARINMAIDRHLFGIDNFGSDRKANASTVQLRDIELVQRFVMRKLRGRDVAHPVEEVISLIGQY